MRFLLVSLFGFSLTFLIIPMGCKDHRFDYIDTVACPVVPAVNKIKITHNYFNRKIQSKTKAFYDDNGYKIVWLDRRGSSNLYKAFKTEVLESFRYGMNPEDYQLDFIDAEIEKLYDHRKPDVVEIAKLDLQITASFFLFTTHMIEGRIRNPGAPEFIWKKGLPNEDDVDILLKETTGAKLRRELDKLQPPDPQYEKLRTALEKYRKLEAGNQFKPLRLNRPLKPGQSDDAVPHLRNILTETDLHENGVNDSTMYDDALVTAVKKFQKRHGLTEDGIVRGETLRFLNLPFNERADMIALNLERLRWRPFTTQHKDDILINVPEYFLRVYHNKKEELSMRVVLGSDFNATPIFNDTLKYIAFSPTWNVPQSILEEEFLPNLQANPEYYSQEFIFYHKRDSINPAEVDWNDEDLNLAEFRAVQRSGDLNALGKVKFIMPNNFNIYLHDTPADALFKRKERALSHGCVRLEKPVELAEYLLRDQPKWNRKRIEEAMDSEEPINVNLKKPYPVHIVYRTVWVDDDNEVNFREDIYGHDKRQLAQLKKAGEL
jgi:murein L,D-transpeptidase YcbB/YkuD